MIRNIIDPQRRKLLLADLLHLEQTNNELIKATLLEATAALPIGFTHAINKRKSGDVYQYYWRKKTAGSRKYQRLDNPELQAQIKLFDCEFRFLLKGIEKKLLIVNANLKYMHYTRALLSEYDILLKALIYCA